MKVDEFSERIHAGYEAAITDPKAGLAWRAASSSAPLRSLSLEGIGTFVRSGTSPQAAGDVLAAVLARYQSGARHLWGPVILEMLAPAMAAAARALYCPSPSIDEGDIEQQLVAEVLREAARIDLASGTAWIKRRIMARAKERVVAALRSDLWSSGQETDVSVEPELPESEGDSLANLVCDDVPLQDIVMTYRFLVRRERMSCIAADEGLSYEAARSRVRRAKVRLASLRPQFEEDPAGGERAQERAAA